MHPDTARPEGRRDRPCEAPATFPQSMPVVERRGEYLTRDSQTLGSAEQERRGIPTLILPARTGTCRNDGRSRAGSERFLDGKQRDEGGEVPGLLPLQTDV